MNVDELLEQYMNDPKWKGKLFMEDEKTCYTDGLLIGLFLARKEHALLKQQISQLKNDLIVARKDRESREKIEQLEKQICELQSEISSLKEQNLKMRGCYNCKYYNAGYTRCFTGKSYNSNGCLKHWVLR